MSGLETAALIASIAGTAVSAVGAIQQGQAASAAAKQNALNAEANAKIARNQGTERVNRARARARQVLAEQRAAFSESGFVANTGSNLALASDTGANLELDALTEKYSAELDAQGFQSQAKLSRMEAKTAKTSGYLSSAGALLSGVGDINTAYKNMS